MSDITLERAKKHLEAWLDAELAVSTGQSYRIGTRQITRADIEDIRKQIAYWQRKIKILQGKSSRKVYQAIPRDW